MCTTSLSNGENRPNVSKCLELALPLAKRNFMFSEYVFSSIVRLVRPHHKHSSPAFEDMFKDFQMVEII